jgi:hypothetical protein
MEELDLENKNEQYILDELRKLQEQLSTPSMSNQIITHPGYQLLKRIMSKPACILVFAYYSKFKKDIVKLLYLGCIDETDNGLEWKRTKQFLAEYFGSQKIKNEVKINNKGEEKRTNNDYNRWEEIENLFTIKGQKVRGLKASYKNAKKKTSKDFDELHEKLDVKAPSP